MQACAQYFTSMISLNAHDNPVSWAVSLSLYY